MPDEAHPVSPNDALRFLLELSALAALGYWGWTAGSGRVAVALATGLPLAAAVVWGVFRVPDDPGPAPVAVAGPVRLVLEATLFGAAVALLALAAQPVAAALLALLVVGHYVLARDRVAWLLAQ